MPGSQRYKLTIAYRGTRYHGWQVQAVPATWTGEPPPVGEGIPTVQQVVSRTIAGVVGHTVDVIGSSRTDAGVHAKGQVAHVDTHMTQIPPEGLRRAVNARLPDDVLIRAVEPVDAAFDAIRSTTGKRYQYAVWTAADRPVFAADLLLHRWRPLDVTAMRAAVAHLVGEHDFASFARPGHGKLSTVRTIRACGVTARGPRLVIGVEGGGFLWHMVRIIAGTLLDVGLGRTSPDAMPGILAARDRRTAGPTAPPHGLYLQWVRTADAPVRMPEDG